MTLQDEVWWITRAGVGGVALVFLYVIERYGTAFLDVLNRG